MTLRLAGIAASVVVAVALYSRFGINGTLSRDEGIYVYGGQLMAHGTPPYASVFDPKTPLATIVAGVGALLARLTGLSRVSEQSDIYVIRIVYLGCACLTVVAVYLLAGRLFRSTLAAVTAAVVLACTRPFAADALAGPDAKTPGVLCVVVAMLLMVHRRWLWAGVFTGLAILTWQPFAIYAVAAVALAFLSGDVRRDRMRSALLTVAGIVAPFLLVGVYFAVAGAFGKFVECAFAFPLEGLRRDPETVAHRLGHIATVIARNYGLGGLTFWLGAALLLAYVAVTGVRAAGASRRSTHEGVEGGASAFLILFVVLAVTLLGNAAYAATDFQSYPDLYPFVAYPALGYAAVVGALVRTARSGKLRSLATTAVVTALAVLAAVSWTWFGDVARPHGLRAQRAGACAVERLRVPGTSVLTLGDPSVPAVMHEQNAGRYIYLNSGVDLWKLSHTPGGFDGWTRQIQRSGPSVVVLQNWESPVQERMQSWLEREGYAAAYVGQWHVWLSLDALARSRHEQVVLTDVATGSAKGPAGHGLPRHGCA